MEDLIKILNKLTTDFGISILENPQRFKSAFTDYSEGKFRGERELLTKIIEIGSYNAISNAEDLLIAKKVLVKKLHDEYFMEEKACSELVDVYTSLLREDNVKSGKIEKPEIEMSTVNSNIPNMPISSMRHIISTVNSWSFDVPIFQGNLVEYKNKNEKDLISISYVELVELKGNYAAPSHGWSLARDKQGYRPSLISDKIESLSAYIANKYKSWGNPLLTNQKQIKIDGLLAEYYQHQVEKIIVGGNLFIIQNFKPSYIQGAFLETEGYFYHFQITVPLEKRAEYQEQMDAFLHSIKLG